jgi:DNA-binding IclR family transcriptional regulator
MGMRTSSASGEERGGVAALERGLSILEAFKQGKEILSLAELAGLTGLYKSTILRLCDSLLRFGYLQRMEDGRFRLGAAVFPLARVYQRAFNLRDAVVPALRSLTDRTSETSSFYVRDGDSEVCLHRTASPHPVRDAGVGEGARFAIDNSACSVVLSAFLGARGDKYDKARRDVVVIASPSNRIPGVSAVVCPVFTVNQTLAGALLLSGPETRFTDGTVPAMRAAVVDEAIALTRSLGGDPVVFESARLPQAKRRKRT